MKIKLLASITLTIFVAMKAAPAIAAACLPENPAPLSCYDEYDRCIEDAEDSWNTQDYICLGIEVINGGLGSLCKKSNENRRKENRIRCAGDLAYCWVRNACG